MATSPTQRSARRPDAPSDPLRRPADRPSPEAAGDVSSGWGGRSGRTSPGDRGRRPADRRGGGFDFWLHGFPVLLVVLVMAIPVLVWTGWQIVLNSSDGRQLARESDPGAPGYEALVEPTPITVLAHVADGRAVGVTALVHTGETDGAVLLLSVDTAFVNDDGVGETLRSAYDDAGLDGLRAGVERVVGSAVTEAVQIDDEAWAEAVADAAPVRFEIADDVVRRSEDGTTEVLFGAGEVELAADEVGPFLAAGSGGMEEINRLLRIEAFWSAWLADPSALAGASEDGDPLASFLSSAAAGGTLVVEAMPVAPLPVPGTEEVAYIPDPDAAPALLAETIPFPSGVPPGSRIRTRLLDGTGRLQNGLPAAQAVVAGGGEVTVIGNTPSFGATETVLTYHDPARAAQVRLLRDALGVGKVEEVSGEQTGFDVTVVLGSDAEELFGADGTTVSTRSSGGEESTGG